MFESSITTRSDQISSSQASCRFKLNLVYVNCKRLQGVDQPPFWVDPCALEKIPHHSHLSLQHVPCMTDSVLQYMKMSLIVPCCQSEELIAKHRRVWSAQCRSFVVRNWNGLESFKGQVVEHETVGNHVCVAALNDERMEDQGKIEEKSRFAER